jgi:hypothetical protein
MIMAASAGEWDDAAALPLLAFVHIPKTAGTSITNALKRLYGAACFPAMTTLDYRKHDDAALQGYRCFRGHAYRCDYERLPAGTSFFTVLRDPVERALSYYNYYRALADAHVSDRFVLEASRLAKTASVIEFIYSDSPFIIEHLRLGQMRQFLTQETLRHIAHRQFLTRALRRIAADEFMREMARFDFVLTCDCLALTFPLMTAQLGLPVSCRLIGRDNASAASDDVDPADIRRALIDVNAAEFTCYDFVRRRQNDWIVAALTPHWRDRGILPQEGCPA